MASVWIALAAILLIAAYLHSVFAGDLILFSVLDEFRLSRLDLAAADAAWASHPRRSDVVISLTTIPSRLPHIDATLKSLMRQTLAPAEIRLNVPAFSKRERAAYVVPERLRTLRSLTIVSCDDYGPATKLIPSVLSLAPDRKIVVVDDDRIFPRTMLADLESASRETPDAACALSGWIAPPDLIDRPATAYLSFFMIPPAPIKARRLWKRRRVDIVQGLSGYLVKPRFFDAMRLTDYSKAPEAAFYVDDVWISAHCRASKYVVPSLSAGFPRRHRARFYKQTSVALINRGGGDFTKRNNTIVLQYFADSWTVGGRSTL
ncbi:MAG: hypothetical protein A3G76_13075 [Acidobacteria bacterium RIFCSPLOWO2_12_FULL_65_11]|nr:MAG: hypothetical protein A3H95_06645 [Acidobacteria bacterium RIFCSPLOWO2_02_FULL_64_15]OFW33538.1 MAG: hypothetical protein A3G76_13075 [Acidobacteria bacterium RIFCSPLOWO2_12_FULL_65_11]